MTDEYFMREALKEAKYAFEEGEVPVGAVVVANNQIISRGHNQTQALQDVTAHAEMIALTAAANTIGAKYLIDCTLYVTLEPCVMCAGAAYWTQISKIVYGASDAKRGFQKLQENILHPKTTFVSGILAHEAETLMKAFFQKLR
jgi:tRNA(adenine34) deaminase